MGTVGGSETLLDGEEAGLDLPGVGKLGLLGLQLLQFPFAQGGCLELMQLGLPVIVLGGVAFHLPDEHFAFAPQLAQGIPAGPGLREEAAVAGVAVEAAEPERWIRKQEILVLRVDVHQVSGQFLQHGQGHGQVVDERTGTPGPVDDAPDEQAAVLPVELIRLQDVPDGTVALQDEFGLDHAAFAVGSDDGGIRLAAQHEGEGAEQDGFSRTGLARNNDETLRKINLQRVNQNVIPDVKGGEHPYFSSWPAVR